MRLPYKLLPTAHQRTAQSLPQELLRRRPSKNRKIFGLAEMAAVS
jgi:hypothetical protein